MTMHTEGIADADLDRFEKAAEPIYRSTATAGEASRFQVSDLGMWVIRLVAEVRRARTQGADAPTDDEVNAVALAYWGPSEIYDRERLRAALAGFRRSEVPEPSAEDEFAPGECDGSGTCSAPRHIHGCYTLHRADQCDAPDEYGHLPSAPQGETSDARGIIARRLIREARMDSFSAWDLADDIIAALRAAGGVR